jgi:hypothetical protein
MKCNIISDINEIQLFVYTKKIHLHINCKKKKKEKNEKNWIEPTELKLLYWIFYSST